MTTTETIEQRVIRCVSDYTGLIATEITADSHLFRDLMLDSLGAVEVVMQVEDEFEVELDDDVVEDIVTVRGLVDAVAARLPAEVAE